VAVDASIIALVDVTLIDGSGAAPRHGQSILIEDTRISAVGPKADVPIPDRAPVLALAGRTVIPGLVGLHEHTHRPGLHFTPSRPLVSGWPQA
jgi:enamidase